MMPVIILYTLTFLLIALSTYLNKRNKTLLQFFLILQLFLFFIPLKNLIVTISKEGIPLTYFSIIVLFQVITQILILYFTGKKKQGFFANTLLEIEKAFNNFVFFNKHTYYFYNTYIPKVENVLRPLLTKKPLLLLFYFTFLPNVLIFIVSFFEFFLIGKLKIAWVLFLLSLFLFRILRIALKYVTEISNNTVNYYFGQILFLTYLPPLTEKIDLKKENLYRLINSENLNRMIFLDKNRKSSHLIPKFIIIENILHFSRSYFISYALNKYLFFRFRLLANLVLFLSLCFLSCFDFFFNHYTNFLYLGFDFLLAVLSFSYYAYQKLIAVMPFPRVSDMLIRMTKFLPEYWISVKKQFVRENFLTLEEIKKISVKGLFLSFVTKKEKPKFWEGFQEISYFGYPSKGFVLKNLLKAVGLIFFIVFSYILVHQLLIQISSKFNLISFLIFFGILTKDILKMTFLILLSFLNK